MRNEIAGTASILISYRRAAIERCRLPADTQPPQTSRSLRANVLEWKALP
jgi:hypothetical protein